jgi:sialate O-acetylesterase
MCKLILYLKNYFAMLRHKSYLMHMISYSANERAGHTGTLQNFLAGLFVLLFLSTATAFGNDLRKAVPLNGYWKFSIGDIEEWRKPEFNDSDWDEIRVPGTWEDQGYNEYNGYAWYRKKFKMYEVDPVLPIYLLLGRIDDTDEVYLNGRRLGGSGGFPPNYFTAYNQDRRYLIPREYLNFNGTNTLAVKVFDEYMGGGIVSDPVGIYVDESYHDLDMIFPRKWKFHLGDNSQWKSPTYDDGAWVEINVPSGWEQEGFPNYDGYAWYRLSFILPSRLKNEKLYISLGKIDDQDYVYLNGHLIGNVFELRKDNEYKRRGYEYNARRVYPLPSDLLKTNGKNVIAVRVYDSGQRGGIYEGPIGIMTELKYKAYFRKHYSNRSFWDYMIEEFIDY